MDKDNHVLLTQRHSALTFPHSWVAPGGKVDPGESFLQAAVREVKEEAGIEIDPHHLQPIMLYESTSEVVEDGIDKAKNHILVKFFAAHLTDKEKEKITVTVQETEVQNYSWVHEDDLYALLCHNETEEDLQAKFGQHSYENYSKIYPNTFQRGLPEGHVLSFLSYYRTKKGIENS